VGGPHETFPGLLADLG